MMRDIIHGLPDQMSESLARLPMGSLPGRVYDSVLVCGMGGSGISGDILAALYPRVRIVVNRDYDVPDFVDKKTLAILVSYSGNTEETLSNYRQLRRRSIDTVLISSDGALHRKEGGYKIRVPAGLPPRGALGHLFTPLPMILHRARLIPRDPRRDLERLSSFLRARRGRIERSARTLAQKLVDRLLILYADSPRFAVVANRWRCQLNENAKVLAHCNVIPEMNHNEIVGLGRPQKFNPDTTLVFINDPGAHPRNRIRRRLLRTLIAREIPAMVEIKAAGRNAMEQMFWAIMLGDFVSYYLARAQGIDPMPVTRIEALKRSLARHGRGSSKRQRVR